MKYTPRKIIAWNSVFSVPNLLHTILVISTGAGASIGSGCSRQADGKSGDPDSAALRPGVKSEDVLIFPDDLRVEDPAVNDYVRLAMTTCAGGDYELFRLMWSAREEVLPRDEYEQGWQAVREIRLTRLEKVMLAPNEKQGRTTAQTVYALLADVSLDPEHPAARNEPNRQVALMIVREHDDWKLARAPRTMREWLRNQSLEIQPREANTAHKAESP